MTNTAVLSVAGQAHLPSYTHTATTIGTTIVLIIIVAGATISARAYRHRR